MEKIAKMAVQKPEIRRLIWEILEKRRYTQDIFVENLPP